MLEFQYNLPVNLVFGRGKADTVGKAAAAIAKRVLIVTGGNSTKRSGLLSKIVSQLVGSGVSFVIYDRITPNPVTTTVYQGAEIAVAEKCDAVLAIGGGSSLDAGKAIAFQAVNGGDINEYIFGTKSSDKALPVIAVPTTCGTGSEGNGFAVVTNPDTLDKKSLRCKAIVPACSIVDPLLMATMPKATLAAVGFDALCHNIDAYVSSISQPLTDILALEGVKLAAGSLVKVYQNPADMDSWDRLCLASTLGGMVINTAGVTALHGMEHPVSGLKDIVHGIGLAALAPAVFEESIKGLPGKFSILSKILGGNDENDFVPAIGKLLDQLDLNTTLGEQGITASDVDWLAQNCMKVSAPSIANHPVIFGLDDLKRIYLKAL